MLSNSQVPRIELNQNDTIRIKVNVYGFDDGTPVEISGQAIQVNGAVATFATFYSVQEMPKDGIIWVESIQPVPPNKFVAGQPITVVARAAEAWVATLEADTANGKPEDAGSVKPKAAWKESNYSPAVSPHTSES